MGVPSCMGQRLTPDLGYCQHYKLHMKSHALTLAEHFQHQSSNQYGWLLQSLYTLVSRYYLPRT